MKTLLLLPILLMLALTVNASAQGLTEQYGGYNGSQWSLSTRGVHNFPVPMFRPTTPNSRLAIDFSPNGHPTQYDDGQVVWGDGCAEDLASDPYTQPPPIFHCFRFGAGYGHIEMGESYFGATKPLPFYLSLGVNNPKIILNTDGSVSSPGIMATTIVGGVPLCGDPVTKQIGACAP